eukprot:3406586-Karenia_brevis.AAC.1
MPMFSLETDCNNDTSPSRSPRQQDEEEHISAKETRKRGRWRKSSMKREGRSEKENKEERQDRRTGQDECTRKECMCRGSQTKKKVSFCASFGGQKEEEEDSTDEGWQRSKSRIRSQKMREINETEVKN